MAYYCLHKFHWPPSRLLALPERERAFIIAAVQLRAAAMAKEQKKAERKSRKR